MKNILRILYLGLLLFPFQVYSQGDWIDATNLVGNGEVTVTDMAIDTNNATYITGRYNTNIVSTAGSISSNGSFDIFLVKISSNGSHEWITGIGGDFFDLPGGVEVGPDNSLYVTGSIEGTVFFDEITSVTTNSTDAFLANYYPDGTLNWVKIIANGPNRQRSESMILDQDKIIFTGLAIDSIIYDNVRIGYPGYFTHVTSVDFSGNYLLHNIIGFKVMGLPTGIASTSDGYVISGYFRDSIFFDIDTLYNSSSSTGTDIYLYKTDKNLAGQWIRRTTSSFGENVPLSIKSNGLDDIYVTGKTGSLDLYIDSTDTQSIHNIRTTGSEEFFIFKYNNLDGYLDWYDIDGSASVDGISDILILPNRLLSTGYISRNFYYNDDTLVNQTLTREIFIVQHDLSGNIEHAIIANSEPVHYEDQGYKIFQNKDNEILISGVYRSEIINFGNIQFSNISPGEADVFLGKIGCKVFDDILFEKMNISCYGDSSGYISLNTSGGFGPPYNYSIDSGISFQKNNEFLNLPAGNFQVIVTDNKKCSELGPIIYITQPDSLMIELISSSDITNEADGSIVVAATGGTTPYTFTLLPDNILQGFGTYTFQPGDSGRYVVQVDDANNCGPVETDSIDILDFYGVGFEDISDLKVRIFPNPSSRMITLEMPLEEAEVTLEIMSLTGQVVMSLQAYPSGGVLRENIDVSDLSKGMYMVRVNGQTLRSGIVVN